MSTFIKHLIVATNQFPADDIVDMMKRNELFEFGAYSISINHIVFVIREWYNDIIHNHIANAAQDEIVHITIEEDKILDVVDLDQHYPSIDAFLNDIEDMQLDPSVYNESMCFLLDVNDIVIDENVCIYHHSNSIDKPISGH